MWTHYTTVNGAMNNLTQKMDNVVSFPTKGFQTDGIHYQGAGMIDLGEAFAQAYLEGDFISTSVSFCSRAQRRLLSSTLAGNTAAAPVMLFDLSGRKVTTLAPGRTTSSFRTFSSGLLIAGRRSNAARVLHVKRD
jgi:hypothetical protein